MCADTLIRKLGEAKKHLEAALSALDWSEGWSIIDIFGLPVIPDIFEYSEFSSAKKEVEAAADIIKDVKAGLGNTGVQTPEIDHMLS